MEEKTSNYLPHHLELSTEEPLTRVMALHALAYCERLFYLEEVEEIRVADDHVYAGRRLHEELDKGTRVYNLELSSERLGIRGQLDFVRRQSGRLVVYEHKKGRSREGKEAWPSDRLQVLAYALLLAEHTGEHIEQALIRYHEDNKTIKIPVCLEDAETEVLSAIKRAKELRNSLERPPVSVPEKLCRSCSLAPVCLPEEERFALREKSKPLRLFPPVEDRRVIHVVEQGSSVSKDGEQLIVSLPDGSKKPLPGKSISALVLHGNIQISTQTIHFCAANDIGVHWLSYGGHYVGALTQGAGMVQRRNRQYGALQSPLLKTKLALRLSKAKAENQLKYILRATRSSKDPQRPPEVTQGIGRLREEIRGLDQIHRQFGSLSDSFERDAENDELRENLLRCTNRIRGHEGKATSEYFRLVAAVLNLPRGDFLYFHGRNRRPPKDPFNALLSFGYALLYKDCIASLLAVGLDPSFGFFHTPRSPAYPLALDLMELFRLILWDIPLVGSVNRKQWSREDFDFIANQVWLNANGRRKAISLYENRKGEKWKHPVLEYSLSYSRTIELEARLLEKEWTGQPGLFAQIRLR